MDASLRLRFVQHDKGGVIPSIHFCVIPSEARNPVRCGCFFIACRHTLNVGSLYVHQHCAGAGWASLLYALIAPSVQWLLLVPRCYFFAPPI